MDAVETLTGKVVSNIDQGVIDHEFQNKKEHSQSWGELKRDAIS